MTKILKLCFPDCFIILVMLMPENDLWTYLKNESASGRPLVLYGTGNGADKIINELDKYDVKINGIFASPGFVRDRTFHGIKVESFEDCFERLGDSMIVLMCFGSSRPEVLSYADHIRGLVEFYAPDVPVYGDNLFDIGFYREHLYDLSKTRGLFNDDLSLLTFDDIIAARLTGNIGYLKDCEVTKDEADLILPRSREGLFIDLGAYDGDTVQRYSSLLDNLAGIIAVEPDSRNMRKLKSNSAAVARDINTEYVQAFVSDREGIAHTGKNLGRGTSISGEGKKITAVTSIDRLAAGRPVSFIKFDVEGEESSAIKGGRSIIEKYRPSMCIACYHRSEDLYVLPRLVIKINPGYKVYMRHTPSIPGWDTYFYFI